MFSGDPINISEEAEARKQERFIFSNLSVSEKCSAIFGKMENFVGNDLGYKKSTWHKSPFSFQVNWKQIGSTLFFINCFSCDKSFTKQSLDWFYSRKFFSFDYIAKKDLPAEFNEYLETIKLIRRITLWAFLDGVSQNKVMANFPSMRKSEIQHHYYHGEWQDNNDKNKKTIYLPSSNEMVLIDKIKSLPDFTETLEDVIKELEKDNKATVFAPEIKKAIW
ncbi:MAG TPA: hypothetical protein PLT08_14610 [Anaerolineales bacterium]|nr:hypothetical protein [Anaerolineales bacterium]